MALKKYLHIFLLLGVITFKLSLVVLHVHLSHQDNDQEVCELCEHALQNQDLDALNAISSYEEITVIKDQFDQIIIFKSVNKKSTFDYTCFGRPPPYFSSSLV